MQLPKPIARDTAEKSSPPAAVQGFVVCSREISLG